MQQQGTLGYRRPLRRIAVLSATTFWSFVRELSSLYGVTLVGCAT